jgi:hypothetical protein
VCLPTSWSSSLDLKTTSLPGSGSTSRTEAALSPVSSPSSVPMWHRSSPPCSGSHPSFAYLRVRVERMGWQTCRIVGESQPVLIMISPIISTRTRSSSSPLSFLLGNQLMTPQALVGPSGHHRSQWKRAAVHAGPTRLGSARSVCAQDGRGFPCVDAALRPALAFLGHFHHESSDSVTHRAVAYSETHTNVGDKNSKIAVRARRVNE